MSEHSARSSTLPGLAGRIRSHELAVETVKEQRSDGSSKTTFSLVPGPGTHYFKFQDTWFQVSPVFSRMSSKLPKILCPRRFKGRETAR